MADKSFQLSTGGQACTTFTTSGSGDTVLSTSAGRLCSISILTGGITNIQFYDSSTTSGAATAKHVYTVARTTTGSTGKVFDLQIPLAYGLVVARAADAPGCVVTFTRDTTYGR